MTRSPFNLVTTHVLHLWSLLLAHLPAPLKITSHSFRYAAPSLWNELPTDLREPRQTQSPALSPITHGISSSSPSSLSPLASSLTRLVFQCSSIDPFLYYPYTTGLITRTLGPSNDFTLLSGCTERFKVVFTMQGAIQVLGFYLLLVSVLD